MYIKANQGLTPAPSRPESPDSSCLPAKGWSGGSDGGGRRELPTPTLVSFSEGVQSSPRPQWPLTACTVQAPPWHTPWNHCCIHDHLSTCSLPCAPTPFTLQGDMIVLVVLGYTQNYTKLGVSPGPQYSPLPRRLYSYLPSHRQETSLVGHARNPRWGKTPSPLYTRTSAACGELPSVLSMGPHTPRSPVLWRIPALPLQRPRGFLCGTWTGIQCSSLSSTLGLLLPQQVSSESGKEGACQIIFFPLFSFLLTMNVERSSEN